MKKIKIFIISQKELASASGGSCSINFDLCGLLISNGFDITDIVYSEFSQRPEKLDSRVKFVNLYDETKSFSQKLSGYLENNTPDLFIFFFASLYVQADLPEKYAHIPRILMFHSRPDYYFASDKSLEKLETVYKNTISQILFPSYYNLLPDYIKNSPVTVIPNFSSSAGSIDFSSEKKKIVYLSRIDNYKQQDFLIAAFLRAAKKLPGRTLDIYGEGENYYIEYLQNLINDMKLSDRVFLKGVTDKPLETLKNYDFCVFPSCFEGFPVGLIEAQSIGLAAIGLKKASGVNELIIDGFNGFLTDYNTGSFADAIIKLGRNKELRKKMSINTLKSAGQYSKEKWDKAWLDLIYKAVNSVEIEKIHPVQKNKKTIFSIDEIQKISRMKKYIPLRKRIFSVERTADRTSVYFMGLKFSRKYKGG